MTTGGLPDIRCRSNPRSADVSAPSTSSFMTLISPSGTSSSSRSHGTTVTLRVGIVLVGDATTDITIGAEPDLSGVIGDGDLIEPTRSSIRLRAMLRRNSLASRGTGSNASTRPVGPTNDAPNKRVGADVRSRHRGTGRRGADTAPGTPSRRCRSGRRSTRCWTSIRSRDSSRSSSFRTRSGSTHRELTRFRICQPTDRATARPRWPRLLGWAQTSPMIRFPRYEAECFRFSILGMSLPDIGHPTDHPSCPSAGTSGQSARSGRNPLRPTAAPGLRHRAAEPVLRAVGPRGRAGRRSDDARRDRWRCRPTALGGTPRRDPGRRASA